MLKRFSRYLSVLFMIPLLVVNSVSAKISESTLYFYGQNNILYFVPDGCTQSSKRCVLPTGNQITWIGDSYSTGAASVIKEMLPGISFGNSIDNPDSYIQACKFVSVDTTCNAKPTNPSGLNVLRDVISAGELKPYLVFALGTNGGWTDNDVSEFKQIMSGASDTKVVLVTSMIPTNDYADSNRRLKDLANSNENYYLADWTEVYDSKYFEGDSEKIHPVSNGGYKKWVETIVNALPQNCTEGGALLPGTTVREKIWNWLVNYINSQNFSNADTSAIVAGIMGNFYVESGFNPFMVGSQGGYYGLYMLFGAYGGDDYVKETNEAVGGNYFKFYGWWKDDNTVDEELKEAGLSSEQIDQAIDNNLKVLTHGAAWAEFVSGVKGWGVADTPRGYSDLFLVTVERAINGESPIEDPAVARHYSGNYQGSAARRYQADRVYGELANSTAINPTIGSGGSQTTGVINNENYKGEKVWSDSQLEIINRNRPVYESASQQYGIPWQAIATVHRLETGLALSNPSNGQGLYQLYSYTDGGTNSNAFLPAGEIDKAEFQRQTNIAAGIMKSIIESGGYSVDSDDGVKYLLFSYNNRAPQYIQKALDMGFSQKEADAGEGSPYVMNRYDAKRDPNSSEMSSYWPGRFIDDGVFDENAVQADFGGFVLYTALGGGSGNSSSVCGEDRLVANGDLVKFVVKYAWPEYHEPVFLDAMPDYEEAYNRRLEEHKYVGSTATMADCGGFVTTIIQESGFDPDYNKYVGATYQQEKYLVDSPDWELVNDSYNQPISDESKLSPGDVAFSSCGEEPGACGHTYIYVGEIAGFGSHIASASWDERTPMAGFEAIVGNNINWYHKVK